jgi:hypothetical protein
MTKLKLSVEEKRNLLDGIEEARRRLLEFDEEMTEDDARALLLDTLGDAVYTILKNHRQERLLT